MNKLKDRVIEVHSLRAGMDFGAQRLEIGSGTEKVGR